MEEVGKEQVTVETPVYSSPTMMSDAPSQTIPQHSTSEEIAYQMVKDETFAQIGRAHV